MRRRVGHQVGARAEDTGDAIAVEHEEAEVTVDKAAVGGMESAKLLAATWATCATARVTSACASSAEAWRNRIDTTASRKVLARSTRVLDGAGRHLDQRGVLRA